MPSVAAKQVIKIKLLVNCALPYANGPLHLGHIAGAYIGADIFVRHHRMIGDEVLFVSGSDEYGSAITIRADKENTTPDKIADKYHSEHVKTFERLDINFDIFTRTTYPEHGEAVGEIFLELKRKNYFVEKSMISPFCANCNRFMPDRYIEGTCPNCGFEGARGDQCDECGKILDPQDLINPRCVVCGDTPEFKETNHLFLKLNEFQDGLLKWLEGKDFWRHNVLSFTRNFIESGLKERPITRDIDWGVKIPLPGYENKRIYVWFDALIGYLSGAQRYSRLIGREDYWKSFYYDPEVKTYYFIGKDNIAFHCIIWPAILLGIDGINLPYDVPANEYLTFKGQKFSKSRGIGFTADELLDLVGKDYLRYYLAANLPEGGDADFSLEDLVERVNTEYIDKYGNLVHRAVSFILNNSLDLGVPENLDDDDREALEFAKQRLRDYREHLEKVQIKKSLQEWLELVKYGNAYFNRSQPWNLIKTDESKCKAKLYASLRIIRQLTVMIYPFTPSSAEKIWHIIGAEGNLKGEGYASLENERPEFRPVKENPPFQKIIIEDENENKLDLIIGRILEAKEHPNADSLYVLKVSLRDHEIQLVAGLRKHYPKDELKNKKIVVVANLKKAKIRGETSQGMLLAADDGQYVRFLTVPDDITEGTKVTLGELPYNDHGTITIEDLKTFGIKIETKGPIQQAYACLGEEKLYLNAGGNPVVTSGKVKDDAIVR